MTMVSSKLSCTLFRVTYPSTMDASISTAVTSLEMYFAICIEHKERLITLPFHEALRNSVKWSRDYNIYPRNQFDFRKNQPGGLELIFNRIKIISASDYENFVINFAYGWSKILSAEAGDFETGEPGFTVQFETKERERLELLFINHTEGPSVLWAVSKKEFCAGLHKAYADVAAWVREADPKYYSELITRKLLPIS